VQSTARQPKFRMNISSSSSRSKCKRSKKLAWSRQQAMFHRNVCWRPPGYTALHPSQTPPWGLRSNESRIIWFIQWPEYEIWKVSMAIPEGTQENHDGPQPRYLVSEHRFGVHGMLWWRAGALGGAHVSQPPGQRLRHDPTCALVQHGGTN
jgi:hypothetical protein